MGPDQTETNLVMKNVNSHSLRDVIPVTSDLQINE